MLTMSILRGRLEVVGGEFRVVPGQEGSVASRESTQEKGRRKSGGRGGR